MANSLVSHLSIYLGVDTGGTFTDFVCFDAKGVRVHKVLSTPEAPERAILQGIDELGLRESLLEGRLVLIHGSTVATNAALENKGVKTAFVTNAGFADMLTLGRQARSDIYALQPAPAPVPVQADLCFELNCRVDASGAIIEDIDAQELESLVRRIQAAQPGAVAINFLFAYLNSEHERRVAQALKQALGPEVCVSCSSEVLAEYKEYERGIATWLNASLGPIVKSYLARLQRQVSPCLVSVMQSHGGTVTAEQAADRAVQLLLSGPAGGLAAASAIGRLRGVSQQMTFDMGGTSTDVALVDGAVRLTSEGGIGPYPVSVPMVDLYTVGAGGGSIAYVDAAGMLHVGPESAGASPGPACYGRGGQLPTVSDANAVLGRLRPEFFLGGAMALDLAAAQRALTPLSDKLGLDIETVAEGILAVANEHIAAALRVISVQRGYDPKAFELCCFGGAGGLQVCAVAEALNIRSILLPVFGGVLSAQGMLVAERRREASQTLSLANKPDISGIFRCADAMRLRLVEALIDEGLAANTAFECQARLDARFEGQSFTLTVPLEEQDSLASLEAKFKALHQQQYGYVLELPVEWVNVRVSVGAPPALAAERFWQEVDVPNANGGPEPSLVHLPGLGETAVYERTNLQPSKPGEEINGPALICERTTTTLVQKGWKASVEQNGHLLLRRPT